MTNKNTKPKVEDVAAALAAPICQELGCEIFAVEYKKEGADWYLRLFIDREEPVDHELCYAVSERFSAALDKEDPIAGAYFLEVSSPGIERPLRNIADFQKYCGQKVAVKLFAPVDGKREFDGYILEATDEVIRLEYNEKGIKKMREFRLGDIAKAHLIFDFNN